MDFVTFKKAVKLLPSNVSIIMRGRHGIGKTQVCRQLAEEFGLPVIERRLSQLTEGDLIGLPFKHNDRVTKFLPPEWFAEAVDEPRLLFLDEFDRSTHEVQQAAMELILDRSIQGQKIHDECKVYAAINGGKHGAMYNVNTIDPALNDRFWIADIEPTVDEWIKWGREEGNVLDIVLDFIQVNKTYLESDLKKDAYKITPSRRSWTRLSNVLKMHSDLIGNIRTSEGNSLFIAICTGFIGPEATGLFLNFVRNPENHIHAEDILDRFDENEYKIRQFKVDLLNIAIQKISDHSNDEKTPAWTKEQARNVSKFFNALPSELKMSLWNKVATATSCGIENAHRLNDFVKDEIMDILGK